MRELAFTVTNKKKFYRESLACSHISLILLKQLKVKQQLSYVTLNVNL